MLAGFFGRGCGSGDLASGFCLAYEGNYEIIGEHLPTERLSPDLISAEGATLALSFVKDALVKPDNIIKRIGQLSVESIQLSNTILRMIPAHINVAVADKDRVEIVVYALLLDEDLGERAKQIEKMRTYLNADQINDLQALHRDISKLELDIIADYRGEASKTVLLLS